MTHARAHEPDRFISRENARALDRAAIHEFGIPGILLMENAATALADHARRMLTGVADRSATIICGTGNNGGDGFALARKLANAGVRVECALVGDASKVAGDARTNMTIAQKMGIPINASPTIDRPALIVDALFGTGLDRPIEGDAGETVDRINRERSRGAKILAADVPSGLDADTGEPLGDRTVRAHATVTFVLPKLGFANEASRAFTGDLIVGEIGVPRALIDRYAE